VVEDAAEQAVARWEERLLRGLAIENATAWAFRVAANAAKRLGKQGRRHGAGLGVGGELDPQRGAFAGTGKRVEGSDHGNVGIRAMALGRSELRRWVKRCRAKLTKVQFLVIMQLCRPGISIHHAAKALSMDRANFQRTFRRALRAIRTD
jgi:DNA-directed RNA polymerase specialized sigma24 family protein